MNDLISRQAAIQPDADMIHLQKEQAYMQGWEDAKASAEPETSKRIVGKSRDGMTLWYQCDMCNEPVDAQDNFCRGCGRRLINE